MSDSGIRKVDSAGSYQSPDASKNPALMDAIAPATAAFRLVPILENVVVARDTYRLRLGDPAMSRAIKPGQFVMVRPGAPGATDPLLGRPLALYDVVCDPAGAPAAFDVVYLVVGRGTSTLSQRQPGERLAVWGPLGNDFGPPPSGPVIFVAGGIGQTPFLALGRWWRGGADFGEDSDRPKDGPRQAEVGANSHRQAVPARAAGHSGAIQGRFSSRATLLYGVRTAALLAGVDDFRRAGIEVELATDDGTAGHRGFVTDLLARRLEQGDRPAKVVGCGPSPMLAALSRLVERHRIPCDVSLENHMACGFGACFSCVAPIRQADGSIDLRRVCVEGPVVAANRVDWQRLAH
jgi:dihydroorotate dehydrogenase electron transfer subunit